MIQNKSLVLAQHPVGLPIPGQDLIITTSEFDLSTPPPDGAIVIKTHYLSFDPYQRGKMKNAPHAYSTNFKLNEPIDNAAISTVVSSSNPRFKTGDLILGTAKFSEYQIILKEKADLPLAPGGLNGGMDVLSNPLDLDPIAFLGALGMPGLTAYSSLYEIGKPVKGEVIFISAASGAVGQIVGQLAKREGMVVIGSVGSEAKLKFITEELGFDAGFDYKREEAAKALQRILGEGGWKGLDVYYDNVGGEQLDAALGALNIRGRIVSCGSVSQTSLKPGETHGIQNMPLVVGKRLTIRGFIVSDSDMGGKYSEEHQRNMQRWIKDGEIKIRYTVVEGIDHAAEGFVGMLQGKNFGKSVLKISDI